MDPALSLFHARLTERGPGTIQILIAHEAAIRTKIAELDTRLARYKATLDAGGDPAVVAGWIATTKAERAKLPNLLEPRTAAAPLLTPVTFSNFQRLTPAWDATYVQSAATVTARNVSYNGALT